jgi:outer membrane protein assembly factor BamB
MPVESIVVVGGRQKRSETLRSTEWSRFGEAVALTMDLETGHCKELVSYVTPDDARPADEYSVVFKSGSIAGDTLYACTQTEVLLFDVNTGELDRRITLPSFNDVHHVRPSNDGNLWVVSTGLDLLVEVDLDGNVIAEHNAVDTPTWDRFDRDTDYRKVASTKPHQAHPNFVFNHGDDVWVTRFEQKDALCLTDRSRRIDIGVERPHDGVVVGDTVYFTTVDGHLVTADLTTDTVTDVADIVAISESDDALGWMRGLSVLPDGDILLGFSTLRITKIRENVRWVKNRFGKMENPVVVPTHVARYNVGEGRMIWRRELTDPVMDVVFSVLVR